MVVALIGPIGINPSGVTANKIMIAKNIAVKAKVRVFFIMTPFILSVSFINQLYRLINDYLGIS